MYLIVGFFLKIVFRNLIPADLVADYLAGAVFLGAALATVVGVLVEVPLMLTLVKIANNTRHWFGKKE